VSNVVDLSMYRRARAIAATFTPGGDVYRRLTPAEMAVRDQKRADAAAFRASLAMVVVDAATGHELAGVPSIQCARDAPRGKAFFARLTNSHWLYVPNSEVAEAFAAHGTLRKVRLVAKGGR
jgi:hypothetical protein